MGSTEHLQATLYDAYEILQRAILIVADAPFFTYVCEQEHASIEIEGQRATLRWPETHSGYYDSCSIETQSFSFPSVLLLMNTEQIEAWKIFRKRKI